MNIDPADARHAVFSAFFEQHFATVVRYVQRRVESYSVAEEIAADVFTVAWVKFDPLLPFDLPWLYRTAMNKVMNHWTRVNHGREVGTALERLVEEPGAKLDHLDRLAVQQALIRLNPREAEALRLTVWEGLNGAAASQVLGCTVPAFWKLLSRARQHLRTQLDPVEASPNTRQEVEDVRRR